MGLIGKASDVAATEGTRERETANGGKSDCADFVVVLYFYSVFIIFHATMKCKPIRVAQ